MDKVRYHLGRQPAPKRDVRSLDQILKDVVDGLEEPQCENILILRAAWPKLVGPQIAKHSEPGFIKDFTLHIYVNHPGWLPELQRIKRTLLHKFQSQYRELRVRKLNFLLEHK